MVYYKFIMRIGDCLYYEYYPEGKGTPGLLSVMVDGLGRVRLEKSKDDYEWIAYFSHSCSSIERRLKTRPYVIPLWGVAAWY